MCRNGRFKRLSEALDLGFPVDTADQYGNTLLLLASQQTNQRIVEMLLDRRANINHQNNLGNTPLHYAMYVIQRHLRAFFWFPSTRCFSFRRLCLCNVLEVSSELFSPLLLTLFLLPPFFSRYFHTTKMFFRLLTRAYDTEGTLGEYLIGRGADDMLENNLGLSPYDGIE